MRSRRLRRRKSQDTTSSLPEFGNQGRSIIVISNKLSFLLSTIQDKLKESGYQVISVKPDIELMRESKDETTQILYYLNDELDKAKEFLIYLKDICIEDEKLLYLIGEKEQIEYSEKFLTDSIVAQAFERPVNVADMITALGAGNAMHMHKKSILIVDDDGTFLRSAHDWLSDKYRVTMASSGMSAITYLAKHTPDLILLDYEMPVADGKQVLEMIRSEDSTSSTPVMFLTGRDDSRHVMSVLHLKPEGYLLKTLPPEKIHKEVDDFFEKTDK